MDSIGSKNFKEFENKYRERIKKEFEDFKKEKSVSTQSRQYQDFKKQWMPKKLTFYEKACNISESIFKIAPDKKEAVLMQEYLDICHLNVTPAGVKSFSFLGPIMLILIVSFLSVITPFVLMPEPDLSSGMFFVVFTAIFGLILIIPLGKLPEFLANNWRMSVSNEMVLSIFYIVTFMRHTSNLENAIDFAAEHLAPPLSLDLKKVIWDVETRKYVSIKESLDAYLESWKKWNMEYVESMHLIESSLYENSESRRLDSLEKSLRLMLDETYEKMLHYAHGLQSPLTMLNMLGIVLPILGLVILPLVVSFMEAVKWYHLAVLYDVLLPIGIYYLGKTILANRPTGYGQTDIGKNPQFEKYKKISVRIGKKEVLVSPFFVAMSIGTLLVFIGILPLLIHAANPDIPDDIIPSYGFRFLEYRDVRDANNIVIGKNGPFGIGATLLSFF